MNPTPDSIPNLDDLKAQMTEYQAAHGEAPAEGWRKGNGGIYEPSGVFLEGWSLDTEKRAVFLPDGTEISMDHASRYATMPLENAGKTMANPRPLPPPIIEGQLSEGEVTVHSGPSKAKKTMFGMNMALHVAGGLEEFLYVDEGPSPGFRVTRKQVFYVNCELQPGAWDARLETMANSLALQPRDLDGWLHVWQLRGKKMSVRELLPAMKYQIFKSKIKSEIGVIFLDALYNLFGGLEENKAEDMEEAMSLVREFGVATGAAVYGLHHYAKGNASAKNQIDRGSGSGVLARHPDNIVSQTIVKKYADELKHPNPPLLYQNMRRNAPSPVPFFIKFDPKTLLFLPYSEPAGEKNVAEDNVETVEARADWVSLFDKADKTFSRKALIDAGVGAPYKWGSRSALEVALTHASEKKIVVKMGSGKRDPYGLGEAGRVEWWKRHGDGEPMSGLGGD